MAVLVGKKAPLFEADAVVNGGEFVEKFSLEQYIGKKLGKPFIHYDYLVLNEKIKSIIQV